MTALNAITPISEIKLNQAKAPDMIVFPLQSVGSQRHHPVRLGGRARLHRGPVAACAPVRSCQRGLIRDRPHDDDDDHRLYRCGACLLAGAGAGRSGSIERMWRAEAMQLDQMDRLLTSYGDANVAATREALHAYAQSIVSDEWPKLSELN